MLSVMNLHGSGVQHDQYVYAGRGRNQYGQLSVLGNPFRMTHEGERDRVVELYRRYLWKVIQEKGEGTLELRQQLQNLLDRHMSGEAIVLGCYCAPRSCHADVIRKCIEWAAKTGYQFV